MLALVKNPQRSAFSAAENASANKHGLASAIMTLRDPLGIHVNFNKISEAN